MLVRLIDDGFGNPNNSAVIYFEVHNDVLYAGTWNVKDGCTVHASHDGEVWETVNDPGFKNRNNLSVVKMRSFAGYIYVGVWNLLTGAELWRARDPHNQSDWELVMANGLENNKKNQAVGAIRGFSDWLYVGTFNPHKGPQIWRSADGSPGSFKKVTDGSFFPEETTDASILYAWKDHLYLGVEAATFELYQNEEVNGKRSAGCTVWRSSGEEDETGLKWVQVSPPGFGDPQNLNAFRMAAFKDKLYVGTWTRPGTKSAEIWRSSCEGSELLSSWEKVNQDGFGDLRLDTVGTMEAFDDKLYVAGFSNRRFMNALLNRKEAEDIGNEPRGFLFVTGDGVKWESIPSPEFMSEPPYEGIHAMGVFKDRLIIGVQNLSGPCALWAIDRK